MVPIKRGGRPSISIHFRATFGLNLPWSRLSAMEQITAGYEI